MIHIRRLLMKVLPASTENSIPLTLVAQTRSLSCLAVKLHWNAVATTALAVVSVACGPVVPQEVWWGVVAGAVVDGSLVSYQRFRRR
ncbi:hypothetical protein AB0I77_15800 [Streptomyces sp. NPDC050619]|uniref:hypothetical protein n=1 Tax=Streptomyces sp. NPDC050619 TaxID=3157214 RepID=UPI00344A5141